MNCEWCGKETKNQFVYVMVGTERTKPDGTIQNPAEFHICADCMNLAGNQDWDKLNEKLEKISTKTKEEIAEKFNSKPIAQIYPEVVETIKRGICPACFKKIGTFKDKKSEKEYEISGLCQDCQDKVFG